MSRRYQQFFYSFTHGLVGLHGHFAMVQEVKASLIVQDLTYTADAFGVGGNSITIQYVGDGVAGAETVNVTGSAIVVHMDPTAISGSTATQIKTAVDASVAAAALVDVSVSGTGSNVQAVAAATPLAGGISDTIANSILGVSSITQSGVGEVTIVLQDVWKAVQSLEFQVLSATAQDLIPQVKSVNLTTKTIVLNLLTAGTPTDPTSDITIYMRMLIRSSSITI